MYSAFGIVNSSPRNILVEGLQDYRPIGAFSFLGRYRVIDFPISNLSNSDIDRIQVYMDNNKPRSLIEHVGTGSHYNINSKSGHLQLLFSGARSWRDVYNTDIAAYIENMEYLIKEYDLKILDVRHFIRDEDTKLGTVSMSRISYLLQYYERQRAICKRNRNCAKIFQYHVERFKSKKYMKVIDTIMNSKYKYRRLSKSYLEDYAKGITREKK